MIDKHLTIVQIENMFSDAKKAEYIGEPVSQTTHALQCAYFATKSQHSSDVIIASLLHDIGHLANHKQYEMDNLGVLYHEWIGAKLAFDLGFSAKIALLIGHHVDAKRYLAAKKKDYGARLSSASEKTLSFQGGVMSEREMHDFSIHPCFKEILQVRINDEKAKEVSLDVPGLSSYHELLSNNLIVQNNHLRKIMLDEYIDRQWIADFKKELITNYTLSSHAEV